ncbi:MAG TPA: sodium:proton antiporter [Candidatus Competibacteraceae bacterium]|nr:sodium:proton antiporter [Candidatus Competibacteraceae bacterium]
MCSYLNHRYVKFPASIGQMAFALGMSASVLFLEVLGVVNFRSASAFLYQIDFSNVLLHGMLSFLLFAGALPIELEELKNVVWSVSILATVGVIIATFVTGPLVWYAAALAGLDLPYLYALLFGALISPTDPIAILAILKEAGLSKTLYVKIGSESLFNDGISVVAFVTILGLATREYPPTVADVSLRLVRETLGGAMLGLLLGWVTYRLLRSIDEYRVEILLTLALAAGGYVLAERLGVSAPLCTVAAGLLIGNRGRHFGMSARSRRRLDEFWELADEMLNAVLFLLIGFEVVVITFTGQHLLLGLFAIAAMLMGRVISVGVVISLLKRRQPVEAGTIGLLTWGGLRGGLSIAMALSLPPGPEKGVILPITYLAVMFSILVQGLTFKPALKFLLDQKRHP